MMIGWFSWRLDSPASNGPRESLVLSGEDVKCVGGLKQHDGNFGSACKSEAQGR